MRSKLWAAVGTYSTGTHQHNTHPACATLPTRGFWHPSGCADAPREETNQNRGYSHSQSQVRKHISAAARSTGSCAPYCDGHDGPAHPDSPAPPGRRAPARGKYRSSDACTPRDLPCPGSDPNPNPAPTPPPPLSSGPTSGSPKSSSSSQAPPGPAPNPGSTGPGPTAPASRAATGSSSAACRRHSSSARSRSCARAKIALSGQQTSARVSVSCGARLTLAN